MTIAVRVMAFPKLSCVCVYRAETKYAHFVVSGVVLLISCQVVCSFLSGEYNGISEAKIFSVCKLRYVEKPAFR